jgi:hypothetical protein
LPAKRALLATVSIGEKNRPIRVGATRENSKWADSPPVTGSQLRRQSGIGFSFMDSRSRHGDPVKEGRVVVGLYFHSLGEIPNGAERAYYVYLLDYGWEEPLGEAVRVNLSGMADRPPAQTRS